MKKKYLKLTKDQRDRGVIFSSQLLPGNTIHEVKSADQDKHQKIDRLMDDSFFTGSHFTVNEVRF